MAKKRRQKIQSRNRQPQSKFDLKHMVERYPNALALVIFATMVFIFFHKVVFGAWAFVVPDAQSHVALTQPLVKALRQNHVYPQWTPYIFGGMPSFGSTMYYPFVYVPYLVLELIPKILPFINDIFKHLAHYILAGMGTFLFLRSKEVNFWGGLLGGITFMFTPFLITMEVFGHGSQMMTAAYIPLVLWAVDRLMEKRSLRNLGLAALVIGLQLQRGHIQIVYYTWMALGLYAIYFVVRTWRHKALRGDLSKSLGALASALVLAFGLSAILYLSVYEYTPFSIRGGAGGGNGAGAAGFDYATQWSFHPKEMLTFLVPSFFGFGGQTYWGAMPFTDYPNYMGILPLALAIFAFVYVRRKTTWFFLTMIVLSLLISFGRHFSPPYKLLYSYLPFFSKFRVPVMILILVQFSVAVLAGMGLQNIVELAKKAGERAKNVMPLSNRVFKTALLTTGALAAVVVLVTLFHDSVFGFMSRMYPSRYQPNIQRQLNGMRFEMLIKDMWIMVVLLSVGLLVLWALLKRSLKSVYFGLILAFLTLVDLWIVDFKLNKPQPRQSMKQYLAADETVNFLKQDKDIFRIFPLPPLFRENRWSAHGLATIGGYFAAKLKLYQSFLDAMNLPNGFLFNYYRIRTQNGQQTLQPIPKEQVSQQTRQVDLTALNLLNVKYVVSPYPIPEANFKLAKTTQMALRGQASPIYIYQNEHFLPRAYLVGKVQVVANQNAALELLQSGEFDPSQTAILEQPLEHAVQRDSLGEVQITDYQLNKIRLQTKTGSPRLLVLGEIYYPKGWHARIDGRPTQIYKTDYLLRSVWVPAGTHDVEFVFESPAFEAGLAVSGVSWLIVLAILAVGLRQNRNLKRTASVAYLKTTETPDR
ncbi:MAG: YfhO family protein [bacterium]